MLPCALRVQLVIVLCVSKRVAVSAELIPVPYAFKVLVELPDLFPWDMSLRVSELSIHYKKYKAKWMPFNVVINTAPLAENQHNGFCWALMERSWRLEQTAVLCLSSVRSRNRYVGQRQIATQVTVIDSRVLRACWRDRQTTADTITVWPEGHDGVSLTG